MVTAANQLGAMSEFQPLEVPGVTAGTKFDQFPGAPSPTVNFIVFKGNYTDPQDQIAKTGVFFRRTYPAKAQAPVRLIANTGMELPNDPGFYFGSTAPPSAAFAKAVFVGLDNEDAPEHGGIYLAPLGVGDTPKLTTLVPLFAAVPDVEGAQIAQFGEGLSFDGRYVAFWAAWGNDTRTITLTCPTDGNKDLIDYCNQEYPGGVTTTQERVNQGIFVYDAERKKLSMVAQTGHDGYDDFVYWTYSGRPPGTGGGDEGDYEPPRWRSSAFVAASQVNGHFRVAFKATKEDATQGIYMTRWPASLDDHLTVVDTATPAETIDSKAPSGLLVTSVGIERDGLRGDGSTQPRLAIAISMANQDASVTWGGIYLARRK